MSIGPDGKWSGLSVHRKRKAIAMTALRKLAGFKGAAGEIARKALKDCAAVVQSSTPTEEK